MVRPTNPKNINKVIIYKETTSGLTSPMQLVDTSRWTKPVDDSTSTVSLVVDSTDASKIPKIQMP